MVATMSTKQLFSINEIIRTLFIKRPWHSCTIFCVVWIETQIPAVIWKGFGSAVCDTLYTIDLSRCTQSADLNHFGGTAGITFMLWFLNNKLWMTHTYSCSRIIHLRSTSDIYWVNEVIWRNKRRLDEIWQTSLVLIALWQIWQGKLRCKMHCNFLFREILLYQTKYDFM